MVTEVPTNPSQPFPPKCAAYISSPPLPGSHSSPAPAISPPPRNCSIKCPTKTPLLGTPCWPPILVPDSLREPSPFLTPCNPPALRRIPSPSPQRLQPPPPFVISTPAKRSTLSLCGRGSALPCPSPTVSSTCMASASALRRPRKSLS